MLVALLPQCVSHRSRFVPARTGTDWTRIGIAPAQSWAMTTSPESTPRQQGGQYLAALAEVPVRVGDQPTLSRTTPREQLTQNAPAQLQETLLLLARTLPGVLLRPALTCVEGSRALHLTPRMALGPAGAFLADTEFAHLHPGYDGSLHLALHPVAALTARRAGWGQPDESLGAFLLFGPRDEAELAVVWALVYASYRYARRMDNPDLIEVTPL